MGLHHGSWFWVPKQKKSQILWLKMKSISYLTVPCIKYPHICPLCSPSQVKAKIKHYIRIHDCGNLLFSSEFMWLCWDLVCLTKLALWSKRLCWLVCMSYIRLLYSENFLMSLNKSSNLHSQSQQCKPFLKLVSFLIKASFLSKSFTIFKGLSYFG